LGLQPSKKFKVLMGHDVLMNCCLLNPQNMSGFEMKEILYLIAFVVIHIIFIVFIIV